METFWNENKHSIYGGLKIAGKGLFGIAAIIGGMIVGALFGSALGGLYALDYVAPEIGMNFPVWLEKRTGKRLACESSDDSYEDSTSGEWVTDTGSDTESVASVTPTQVEFGDSDATSDVSAATLVRQDATPTREAIALAPEVPATPLLRSRTRARRLESELSHA